MKKYAFYFLVLALFCNKLHSTEYGTELRAGYFIPTGTLFREIYGGGGIYSLELNRSLCKCLDGWASMGIFTQDGRSIGEGDSTEVTLIPFALGVKSFYTIKKVRAYVGLGIQANYLHTEDHSPFVISSVTKWGVGVIGKTGVLVNIGRSFHLDIFGDYSYCEIPFHSTAGNTVLRHRADISGFSLGLGILYRFRTR